MSFEFLRLASMIFAAVSAVLFVVAIITRPRGEQLRCPGPRGSYITKLNPQRWLTRGNCWYDLTGLKTDTDALVRCPECGCKNNSAKFLADGRRFRFGLLFLGTTVVAITCFAIPWISSGEWAKAMPTPALVIVERIDGGKGPEDVTKEVDERVNAKKVEGWSASVLANALAEDLIDDDVRWNATRAEDLLKSLWPSSQQALESVLRSGDDQARILAANILRRNCTEPSDDLLWACVEDLRDDSKMVARIFSLYNAGYASEYLVKWADRAEPYIADALDSEDEQQQLLAAGVAGFAGMIHLLDHAAPILIEHIKDNDIRGDAMIASPALYRFGTAIIPLLKEHTNSDDAQLKEISLAIIERLTFPHRPLDQLEYPMPRITCRTLYPLENLQVYSGTRSLYRSRHYGK